ncbi:MAG: HyaD/HybD family hydrogenase maturation endopeptidase [Nitrospirota bacterium]
MKSENSLSNSDSRKIKKIPPYPPLAKGGREDYISQKEGKLLSLQKFVILGVGNLLLSDEGVGVHIANELMKMELPPEVSVVEGGTNGFHLINVITEADRLIVIDAVKGGGAPGSIYRFDINDVRNCPSGFKTSVHQIGILEVIDLSGLIGKTPQTTVIGVEPKSLELGMELSPEIKAKIPRIIELIFEELKKSG